MPGAPSRALPALILMVLGLFWGGTTTIARVVSSHGAPAPGYALWITGVSGTLLLLAALARRSPPRLGRAHVRG